MPQININYKNLNGHNFDEIRTRLVNYLTPLEGQKIHPVNQLQLPKVREALQSQRGYEVQFSIDYSYANYMARELGLFPGVDPEQLQKRYRVSQPIGGTTSHKISIFGKDVGGIGDYPMTIRIGSSDAGLQEVSELYLLNSLRKKLEEVGGDKKKFAEAVMEVYRNAQGGSPECESIMWSLPNTTEGFYKKIKEVNERLWGMMFKDTVNLLRFGYDFLGRPLESMGIHPDKIHAVGSGHFEMLLEGKFGDSTSKEGKKLYAHPEAPFEELAKIMMSEFSQ